MTVKFVKKGLDQNLAWHITSIQFMKERNFHSSAKIVVLFMKKMRNWYTKEYSVEIVCLVVEEGSPRVHVELNENGSACNINFLY